MSASRMSGALLPQALLVASAALLSWMCASNAFSAPLLQQAPSSNDVFVGIPEAPNRDVLGELNAFRAEAPEKPASPWQSSGAKGFLPAGVAALVGLAARFRRRRSTRLGRAAEADEPIEPVAEKEVGAADVVRGHQRRFTQAATQDAYLPRIYLGTMTFGWSQASQPVGDAVATAMMKSFVEAGGVELDTARIYSAGDTEQIIGRILADPRRGFSVDEFNIGTKAHPSQPGGLTEEGIRRQVQKSLEAMGVDRVGVLYLHQPDPDCDLVESLECVHSLVKEGIVAELGLSNYSAIEVQRCCDLCAERGLTPPSYYQGLYNPLNRAVEEELLPTLRKNGIGFIAFNPLAAGLLSGKHRLGGEVLAGRFKDNGNYLPRFYTDECFQGLERIRAACDKEGLSLVQATYSWLLMHSALLHGAKDGLLLGASSMPQLEENLRACASAQALPSSVVQAIEDAWELAQGASEGAFPYWRSYHRDQPGREDMHPGASYNATKK